MTRTFLQAASPAAEVAADSRSRVTLTKAGVHAEDRFLITKLDSGEILLTPVTSIPTRELIVWENERVRTSLQRGIAEAEMGLLSEWHEPLDDGE